MHLDQKRTSFPRDLLERSIEQLCKSHPANLGLYHGKTGACLAYFLLNDIWKDADYLKKAMALLDEVSENAFNINDDSFENGITGIGWAVEWLAQQECITVNTDEILADIDDKLYKTVVYAKSHSLSLQQGALGKALYFYKRLMAQNPNPVRYRLLSLQECLVLLTDEIKAGIPEEYPGAGQLHGADASLQLMEAGQALLFCIKLLPLRVNMEVVETIIRRAIYLIKQYVGHPGSGKAANYLMFALAVAGEKLNDPGLIDVSKAGYDEYQSNLYAASFREPLAMAHSEAQYLPNVFDILCQCDPNRISKLSGWNEAWLLS